MKKLLRICCLCRIKHFESPLLLVSRHADNNNARDTSTKGFYRRSNTFLSYCTYLNKRMEYFYETERSVRFPTEGSKLLK